MKLTFVLPNLRVSGGIKSTIAMADALAARGHEVTLVAPVIPGRDGLGWINPRKTLVQIVRTIQNLVTPQRWFRFRGRLLNIPFTSTRYLPNADFLILTWWADVALLADSGQRFGAKVHFVRSFETWGGPLNKVLGSYHLGLPMVATSKALRGLLEQQTGASNIAIVPNGLDPEMVPKPRASNRDGPTRIGVLYRLQDWKCMDIALEVLKEVAAHHKIQPVLFGEKLKSAHQALLVDLPGLEYHHFPTGKELAEIYRSLDIFLFTSDKTEAFGNPPLEAAACGVAVVTTAVGAVPEYLQGEENALLCAPNDVACLIAQTRRLIEDKELAQKIGDQAVLVSQQLSWDASAQQFERVLRGLVKG